MNIIKRADRALREYGGFKFLAYAVPISLITRYIQLSSKQILKKSIKQSKGRFIIKEINDNKMCLDVNDEGLSHDLIVDGVREFYATQRMKKEITAGDIVVDIGANIGYYALLEAKLVGKKGVVYAIEPVPQNVEILRKNVKLNNYRNIEVYQLAIGDKKGTAPMYVSKKYNWSSMSKNIEGVEETVVKEIEVETTTLDDFLKNKPYPNMIRMDVEGYEYQIIKGMKNILSKKKPLKLFIEFHFPMLNKKQSLEILKTLKKHDFVIVDATAEMKGMLQHKILLKLLSSLEKKSQGMPTAHGHLDLTIDKIIKSPEILSGKWGCPEIFFKR